MAQQNPSNVNATAPTFTPFSPVNKTIIHAGHYAMLMQGDITGIGNAQLSELVRISDNSSILHIVASRTQDSISDTNIIIENIVRQSSPCLLDCPNFRGDFPVHVAVRAGHFRVVQNLVTLADKVPGYSGRKMLEQENGEKNNALHIALENQQKEMAEYLFEQCPQTYFHLNAQNISPLYLAIKAGFWQLATSMVEKKDIENPKIEQLMKGESVVHATIMAKNRDILEKILMAYPDDLIYLKDQKGRTPLSYAAYIGFLHGVDCILTMRHAENGQLCFRNQLFEADDDGSFPIHMACHGGHVQVVERFVSLPENMSGLLNQKGQSILRVAAGSGNAEVVKYLLRLPELVTMINMKDHDGNTPLHLATLGKHPSVVYDLTRDPNVKLHLQSNDLSTALYIAEYHVVAPSFNERLTWLALIYAGVPRSPILNIQNPDQYTSVEMPTTTLYYRDPKQEEINFKDRIDTLVIVSALVATVTFACGFTVPGGYNDSDTKAGMATLDHKRAFQVFVLTNTIAMYSSVLALVTLIWAQLNDQRLTLLSLDLALPLLGTALTMMSVAFMAGLYVVLQDLPWLGILVLVMAGVFLVALLISFIPLCSPTTSSKYRILRYPFQVLLKLMLLASDKGNKNHLY